MALRASGSFGAGETIRQSEIFERRIRVIDVLVPVERGGFWLGCGKPNDCVSATARRSFDVHGEGEFKVVISGLIATMSVGPVFARSSVIKVSLWHKGINSMSMLGQGEMLGMGMGKRGTNMPMAPVGIRLSSRTVAAGEVTFDVTNKCVKTDDGRDGHFACQRDEYSFAV